jgi:hypothetical protein
MTRILLGLVVGLLVGIFAGILAGSSRSDQRCREAAFEEQVSRHDCRLRDVELNGAVVVNVTCALPDGTIVKKY